MTRTLKIYQADAFTSRLFGGNPAAIVPLTDWLPDDTMQAIAAENNLAETAFIVPTDGEKSDFHIRWFTPAIEVRLCGHATLAAAHILYEHLAYQKEGVRFDSLSGVLSVSKKEKIYTLDFPTDILRGVSLDSPEAETIRKGLNINPLEILRGSDDFMAVVSCEADVQALSPDFSILKTLNSRGLIVTAKGDSVDFVSRCFFPQSGIDEDPVTGSAHTALIPYWAEKLGKPKLIARQISSRIGELTCHLKGDRVEISGEAVTYLVGDIFI
jgi:PhzF family phenazine biosynthesis protein